MAQPQQPLDRLNQAARRLRAFENELQWSRALVHATEGFAPRAALFAINGGTLEFRAARNLPSVPGVSLGMAPAPQSAVETKEPVVALRTRGELSEALAAAFGEAPDRRAILLPIITRNRVAGILYADADNDQPILTNALELLTTIAGLVLDSVQAGAGLHSIAPKVEIHDHP